MIRCVGDVSEVRAAFERWAGDRAELEWGAYIPAQHFHVVDGYEAVPVSYTTDIPLLSAWGTPLLFGPGSIHVAHTADEHVEVAELRAAVGTYQDLVHTLIATPS
jgi:acetylornithine deacetylase